MSPKKKNECNRIPPLTDTYDVFVECFRDRVNPHFVEKNVEPAATIFKEVLTYLYEISGGRKLTQIISVGCGTGEELLYLAALMVNKDSDKNKVCNGTRENNELGYGQGVRFLGIDSSEYSIQRAVATLDAIKAWSPSECAGHSSTATKKYADDIVNRGFERLSVLTGLSRDKLLENAQNNAKQNIEFVPLTSETNRNIIAEKAASDKETTLALFLGHTYTHFLADPDKKKFFFDRMRAIGSKFVLIDFHEEWDNAIAGICSGGVHVGNIEHVDDLDCKDNKHPQATCRQFALQTNKEIAKREFIALVTKRKNNDTVTRCLARVFADGGYKFLFDPTEQVNRKCDALITEFCGECHYLPVKDVSYTSGYGAMKGVLFWKVDPEEEIARETVYKGMYKHILPILFGDSKKIGKGVMGVDPVQKQLLSFFDSFLCYGVFATDKHLSFLAGYDVLQCADDYNSHADENAKKNGRCPKRISSILNQIKESNQVQNQGSSQASNDYKGDKKQEEVRFNVNEPPWLCLQPFSAFQHLIPDADVGFSVLLASPAGALFIPPLEHKIGKMDAADKAYASQIEILSAKNNSQYLHATEVNEAELEKSEWLAFPFYYRGFPLFVLILHTRKEIRDILHRSPNLCRELALTLQKMFSEKLKDQALCGGVFEERFIPYFVWTLSTQETLQKNNLWAKVAYTTFLSSLDKPWKSWASMFPEKELRDLESFGSSISDHVMEAINRQKSSNRRKISLWFRDRYFFAGNDHEGDSSGHFNKLLDWVIPLLADATSDNEVAVKRKALKNECKIGKNGQGKNSLRPLAEHVLTKMVSCHIAEERYLNWVCELLGKMKYVDIGRKAAAESRSRSFSDLKNAFCLNRAGVGETFRYSNAAFLSLCEIELGFDYNSEKRSNDSISRYNDLRPVWENDQLEKWVNTLKEINEAFGGNNKIVDVKCGSIKCYKGSELVSVAETTTTAFQTNVGTLQPSLEKKVFLLECEWKLSLQKELGLVNSGNGDQRICSALQEIGLSQCDVQNKQEIAFKYYLRGNIVGSGVTYKCFESVLEFGFQSSPKFDELKATLCQLCEC